jgi:phage shock protein C
MGRNKLYRSRKGTVFGVCQGIADWREIPVGTLRFIVAVSILVTGLFPGLLIYALVALLLPLEPGYGTYYDSEDRMGKNFHATKEDIRRTFEKLKQKVENMEEDVFDKERDWDWRFRNHSE